MKPLRLLLTEIFADTFETLGFERRWGDVVVSDRPDLAQYQCNGALGCAKSLKKNPREVAQAILDSAKLRSDKIFGQNSLTLSLAGPGFINIVCNNSLISEFVQKMSQDLRLGVDAVQKPKTVVIDYGSPNVAKMMHVGHLRSSIIGDALARIYRFKGDKVIGDNHLGDWGTPMGMLICELKRRQPSLPYFDPNFSGPYPKESPIPVTELTEMYPVASKKCKDSPELLAEAVKATDELQKGRPGYKALWEHFRTITVQEQSEDFKKLGIVFDTWLGESFYEDKMPPMVEKLKAQGFAQISEGALVIPLATEQEPELPPLILVKSGGGFLYHTSDLATIDYRVNHFKADLCLYAVDKRQSMHFKQVFLAAQKTGLAQNVKLVHVGFGTMNGKDGKPFKTREGGVLTLKDFMQMVNDEAKKRLDESGVSKNFSANEIESIAFKVGMATMKYADLKNNRMVDFVFDLERFSQFEGNTGPYLLYATVRIKSILRKALEVGFKPGKIIAPELTVERNLQLECQKLSDVIQKAYDLYEPHHLCDYGFNLSQAFNSFYKECHIISEPNAAKRDSWLALCKLVHDELVLCLSLLGIEVPERM